MNYRHEFREEGKIVIRCPFTLSAIDHTWSDHDRPGVFNSCVECNPESPMARGVAVNLHELNERRKQQKASD
jgi:hypothetical protein